MTPQQGLAKVAIALGSNLGDRFFNIELALRLLEKPEALLSKEKLSLHDADQLVSLIIDTSFLYETSPMYVTHQPPFANCACMIETNIPPILLLEHLKGIEATVGRIPSIKNGPRMVDLDILFYGDRVINTLREDSSNLDSHLAIPHPRIAEREFVLRPLHDMIPDFIHPVLDRPIHELLASLPEEDPQMRKVVPFPSHPLPSNADWSHSSVPIVPKTLTYWTYRIMDKKQRTKVPRTTHIMAAINATPDSYSRHKTPDSAVEYARTSVENGASIIDIGGYSAQPGSAFVAIEEEIRRVVPFVAAVSNARLRDTPISIDTFRSEVAEAGIKVGVNCINDIYAFTGRESWPCLDDEIRARADAEMVKMKKIARAYATPVIMVHSRADAGKDEDYSMYMDGKLGSVIRGVQVELGEKIDKAVKGHGGIRRWMVITDPGIGFSKNVSGNLEVLRDASEVVANTVLDEGTVFARRNPLRGFPQLVATSRKGFLREILKEGDRGRDTLPDGRVFATAATIACAVQQGALAVRVHDVREMFDVCKIGDALW